MPLPNNVRIRQYLVKNFVTAANKLASDFGSVIEAQDEILAKAKRVAENLADVKAIEDQKKNIQRRISAIEKARDVLLSRAEIPESSVRYELDREGLQAEENALFGELVALDAALLDANARKVAAIKESTKELMQEWRNWQATRTMETQRPIPKRDMKPKSPEVQFARSNIPKKGGFVLEDDPLMRPKVHKSFSLVKGAVKAKLTPKQLMAQRTWNRKW